MVHRVSHAGKEGRMNHTKIELRNTLIVVEQGTETTRFRADAALLSIREASRRPIQVRFEGPRGSATIDCRGASHGSSPPSSTTSPSDSPPEQARPRAKRTSASADPDCPE